jgi:hypothetical protein
MGCRYTTLSLSQGQGTVPVTGISAEQTTAVTIFGPLPQGNGTLDSCLSTINP